MLTMDTIVKYKMLGLKLSDEDERRLKEWDDSFEKVKVPRKVNRLDEKKKSEAKQKVVRVKNVVDEEAKVLGESKEYEDGE